MTESGNIEMTMESSDALTQVMVRNAVYQTRFYIVLGLWLFCLPIIVLLAMMIRYQYQHPVSPYYFAADHAGRMIHEVPLQTTQLTNQQVADWISKAVTAAYSYDFVNFHAQLQSAQQYFTDVGWRNYMRSLKDSNNLLALKQRKMVVVAKVVDTPQLLRQGVFPDGRLGWEFKLHVLLTYSTPPFNTNSQFSNPLEVIVIVRRQDVLQNSVGLGVVQMNATNVTLA